MLIPPNITKLHHQEATLLVIPSSQKNVLEPRYCAIFTRRPLLVGEASDHKTKLHARSIHHMILTYSHIIHDVPHNSALPFSTLCRMWTMLVNGWELETVLPTLHVSGKMQYPNMPLLSFPNVCPEQLKPNSAFCIEHYSKAQSLGYPLDIRGFLSFCGATKSASKMQC